MERVRGPSFPKCDRSDGVQLRALLIRAGEWEVVRGVTSSYDNVVTFSTRTGEQPGPGFCRGTQIYNTAKARWLDFLIAFDSTTDKQALTVEMVESIDSYDYVCATKCDRGICESFTNELQWMKIV
ncbi:hypothetical protein EVAR_53098_1 [Eumeta japonica]|uniref:Uncharacterized protein n=1 Tax=Eumeta variegata TaxID=151549 RepID=A0A4C1ZGH8_EUMVA|nr:hypothetical protein EVAR_53098_1 [Eumeta japonica]